MSSINIEFADWLETELEAQGWTQSDLARASGLHKSSISHVLKRQRKPGVDFVLAVARALKVSPQDLYVRAGLLPPLPSATGSPKIDEVVDVLKRLPEDKIEEILRYSRYQYKLMMDGEV